VWQIELTCASFLAHVEIAHHVPLPTSAAARRAAARLLLTAGPLAVQKSVGISWPPAHSSKPAVATSGGRAGQMNRRTETDAQTLLRIVRGFAGSVNELE